MVLKKGLKTDQNCLKIDENGAGKQNDQRIPQGDESVFGGKCNMYRGRFSSDF